MKFNQLQAELEAILFAMGKAVPLHDLAKAIEQDEAITKKLIQAMINYYETEQRGVQIIQLENAYQMCTRESTYKAITKITNIPRKHSLTNVLLETLSIIAYKQPITKIEIEQVRGVKSDHAVNKLIEYELICEMGRLNAPGKPILFGTTEEFLRCFGIHNLKELPTINTKQAENFKIEAEEEVQLSFRLS